MAMQRYEFVPVDIPLDPNVVYVPAQGWWCRACGKFQIVNDLDICAACSVDIPLGGQPRATE